MSRAPHIAVFNHSPNLLLLYTRVLSQYGYRPFIFQQELVDFSMLDAVQPDLIILGNIRGYNDMELAMLYQLKKHAVFKSVPVIICSTWGEQLKSDADIIRLAHVFVVSKPFEMRDLIAVIQQALQDTNLQIR